MEDSKRNRRGVVIGSNSVDQIIEAQPVSDPSVIAELEALESEIIGERASDQPMYGPVSFSLPKNATVYPGRRGGKSVVVVQCTVPIMGIRGRCDAAIWGRSDEASDGTKITFAASVPKFMGFDDKDAEDRFLAHIESDALAWNGYEQAVHAATNRLMGIEASKDGKAVRPGLAPRLVKPTTVGKTA